MIDQHMECALSKTVQMWVAIDKCGHYSNSDWHQVFGKLQNGAFCYAWNEVKNYHVCLPSWKDKFCLSCQYIVPIWMNGYWIMWCIHLHSFPSIIAFFQPCSTLRDDRVSMSTHACPHKLWWSFNGYLQPPGWLLMLLAACSLIWRCANIYVD